MAERTAVPLVCNILAASANNSIGSPWEDQAMTLDQFVERMKTMEHLMDSVLEFRSRRVGFRGRLRRIWRGMIKTGKK